MVIGNVFVLLYYIHYVYIDTRLSRQSRTLSSSNYAASNKGDTMRYFGRILAIAILVLSIVVGVAQLTGNTVDMSDTKVVAIMVYSLFMAAIGWAGDNRTIIDAIVVAYNRADAKRLQRRLVARTEKDAIKWYDGICGRIMADRKKASPEDAATIAGLLKKGQYKVVHGALRDPKA